MTERNTYRVLSLDGGGMRGLYTATVLHTLMKRFSPSSDAPELDVGNAFDLIVGTSTGGILACALAAGKSTDEIIKLYAEDGPKIFRDPMPSGNCGVVKWTYRNRSSAPNKNTVLRKRLVEIFKAETVKQLYDRRGIGICIPAVDMATNKAWVFKTPHDPAKHRDDKYLLVDVCMATSAAPLFLPLVAVDNPDLAGRFNVFADGGLWANNPVLIGLVEALTITPLDQPIEILSIGTCPPPAGQVIGRNEVDRGILDWKMGGRALELSLDAQASGYQYTADFIAQYIRKTGRKCDVIRLPQKPPSPEHLEFLGMDKAMPNSIDVLAQLGANDGNDAFGTALKRRNSSDIALEAIFKSMTPLPPASPK